MPTIETDQRSARLIFDLLSDASRDRDLMKRLAAVHDILQGRIVFTTSFGIEDQAIAHGIFAQDLKIEVVTLDTGRLFPETYQVWAHTERRYGRRIPALYPDREAVESLIAARASTGSTRQSRRGGRAAMSAR